MQNSEIRKDFLLDKYVIISPKRAKRPVKLENKDDYRHSADCHFCPENLKSDLILDRIDRDGHWQTVSIANIYPAVSRENQDAYGVQEVIIETPSHRDGLADLPVCQVRDVLSMYARRTRELEKDKQLEYILCFKNQGPKSGASIDHAHSQVFATSLLPPDIKIELETANQYRLRQGVCPYCRLISEEAQTERLIWEDRHIVAIAPYASEYHYEVWIFTKRHLDNIGKLNEGEMESFAGCYSHITRKLAELNLSFNAFMHQVKSDHDQHFFFKVQPRDSIWAGVELGSGLIINTVPPEEAALFYRQ